MMQGLCKDRHGVEGAAGGRRDRPEHVVTPRTLQTDPARRHGDRRSRPRTLGRRRSLRPTSIELRE